MKKSFVLIILTVLSFTSFCQKPNVNFVDFEKNTIVRIAESKGWIFRKLDESFDVNSYSIRYSSRKEPIDYVYVINSSNICSSVIVVLKKESIIPSVKELLSNNFLPDGENRWMETKNGKVYLYTLFAQDGYNGVFIEPYKFPNE